MLGQARSKNKKTPVKFIRGEDVAYSMNSMRKDSVFQPNQEVKDIISYGFFSIHKNKENPIAYLQYVNHKMEICNLKFEEILVVRDYSNLFTFTEEKFKETFEVI